MNTTRRTTPSRFSEKRRPSAKWPWQIASMLCAGSLSITALAAPPSGPTSPVPALAGGKTAESSTAHPMSEPAAGAVEALPPAQFFMLNYATMCQDVAHNERMSTKLEHDHMPELLADKAKPFLQRYSGRVWAIPEKGRVGNLVAVLPTDVPMCVLYAHRMDQATVEKTFVDYATSHVPKGVVVVKNAEQTVPLSDGFVGHTLSYTWSVESSKQQLLLMLTTNPSPTASVQALATLNIVAR